MAEVQIKGEIENIGRNIQHSFERVVLPLLMKLIHLFLSQILQLSLKEVLNQEKSIYIQIAEMIENDILRDIILEEERVPSTNDLAKIYTINPATAAKGINLLVDKGILYKKRGVGMFVTSGAKQVIREGRKAEFYDKYIKSLLQEAEGLGIDKAELIKMIEENTD